MKRPTQQQLGFAVAAGHLDERTHTGRAAATRHCPTCRLAVFVGDDSHLAALTVTIDPQPITVADEALALAAGRKTYTVHRRGGRPEITHRHHRGHGSHPAPASLQPGHPQPADYSVHLEHECAWRARVARAANRPTARATTTRRSA